MDDFKRRDYLVCCVIGALFIGSFLAIESRAIQSMIVLRAPTDDWLLLVYSVTHIATFTVLSFVKIILSKKLDSKSLMADAFNSIIGIIMAVPLVLWDRIPTSSRHAQLDALTSAAVALFLLVIGWKLVHSGIAYHHQTSSEFIHRDNDDINVQTKFLSSNRIQTTNQSTPD